MAPAALRRSALAAGLFALITALSDAGCVHDSNCDRQSGGQVAADAKQPAQQQSARGGTESRRRHGGRSVRGANGSNGAGTREGKRTHPPVGFFNLTEAVRLSTLTFEEQALVLALQGIVNAKGDAFPTLFLDTGYLELWPLEDAYWKAQLEEQRNLTFDSIGAQRAPDPVEQAPLAPAAGKAEARRRAEVAGARRTPPTLCDLVDAYAAGPTSKIRGTVAYASDDHSLAIALTVAGQEGLLPVTESMQGNHTCLARLQMQRDLRPAAQPELANRTSAWKWAISALLPSSSKTVVYNLNRYRYPPEKVGGDSASVDTLSDVDFAVQQQAFVMDFACAAGDDYTQDEDADFIDEVFAQLTPGFKAYGWHSSEFKWVNQTSHGGGAA